MRAILAIGGTDSSGGAGLTRDAAMAAACGATLRPAVTAVTVQTDAAVRAVYPCTADAVAEQIDAALATPAPPGAVKIGMLGSATVAETVVAALPPRLPIVLDPVLKSTSGGTLMAAAGFGALLCRASVVTPNLDELAALCGGVGDPAQQAKALLSQGVQAVLVKGGHGNGAFSTDLLYCADGHVTAFEKPRLAASKRGTGCSLATAIACHLAAGAPLPEACRAAKDAVHRWLQD